MRKLANPELVEAERAKGQQDESSGRERFALVFHDRAASTEAYLLQAMYTLEHDALGTLQLFIVPIGPDPDRQGMRYEAVFA